MYEYIYAYICVFISQTVEVLRSHDYIIIQEIIEEFTENGLANIEMSFDVEQNTLQQDIIDVIIQEFMTQFDHIAINITGFQPSRELRK